MPPPPSPNDHDNTGDDNEGGSGAGSAPQADRNHERAYRRLTRSRDDRMIGGVASGIAQTYGFDVALVRVACAVLALFTFGTAVGAYLIGWLLIPEAGSPSIAHQYMARRGRRGNHDPAHRSKVKFWIAIVLLVIGIDALGDMWSDGWSRFFGPMVLITIGIAILVSRRDDTDAEVTSHHVHVDGFRSDAAHDEGDRHPTAPQWPTRPHPRGDQIFESDNITGMHGNESDRHDYRAQRRAARHERRQARSHITGLTLSVLMLLTGGAWLIDSANIARVSPGAVQAIALCIVGVALIVSAWYGRARLLIPVAFVLTMSCVIVAALDVPLTGGAGERKHLPVIATDVKARYQLGVGHLVVNLTSVQGSEALTTEIVQGIGQVEVLVPKDADVFVTSHIGVGDIVVLSNRQEGLYREQRTMHSTGTGRTIRLNIRVGIGEIRVQRSNPPIDERTSVVTKSGVAQ